MKNLAWINGVISDLADAKVAVEDRGFLLGDGVYEVIRIYNGCPFSMGHHLERLQASAQAIELSIPYSTAEISDAVRTLVEESGFQDAYIYIQLTRGSAKRDHIFPEQVEPNLMLYVREMTPLPGIEEVEPARCITLPDERWMNCHIKTINLLPNLLARQKAHEAGAVEAILYRPPDLVTEGTRSNVFIRIGEKVYTHPRTNLILPGITRKVVLELLAQRNINVLEEVFTLGDLKKADEVWITSTTLEMKPVGEIDGQAYSPPLPGPLTYQLMVDIRERIAKECCGG